MELARIIEALSDPAAYSFPVAAVDVRHTHISAVFLAGDRVYKVKKPVQFGFLDFSTLAKRRHFCEEEVRLNRRLAPDVYLGVVPITSNGGIVKVAGDGETVEWAVKMRRLPDDATLQSRLRSGDVGVPIMEALARKIAAFHAQAEAGPRVAAFGRFEVVAGNARENFAQSAACVGTTVSQAVFDRTLVHTEEALARHRSLIEQRAERGVPRDTHGDLRLAHVYYFPERPPPGDLIVIDCIEFNERFRFADPVSDIAFLFMGLTLQGRRDLGQVFVEAYFDASGDEDGRALLPFYTAYRGAVRGKVEGLKLARPEIPDAERTVALAKARGSWLLALGELETPERKPCLVMVGGLPGTGKSTLARALAQRAGFEVIRSDVVRKELAGIETPSSSPSGARIYTDEWTERTYAECLRRAELRLFEGRRVLVDANFREEAQRRAFLASAIHLGAPVTFLYCKTDAATVRARLANRRGDASDADWAVYLRAAESWEGPSAVTRAVLRTIDTSGSQDQSLRDAVAVLRDLQLF